MTAPERFRTILAMHDGKVIGCLDVTIGFEENEIFDVFVLEEYRSMGYARKLLAMAIGMIDVPTEKEIQAIMKEIQEIP